MKSIRHISRNSSDSNNDTIDTGGIQYTNLNNNKNNSTTSPEDTDQKVEDFVNPLFEEKATPPEYNNFAGLSEDPADRSAYDELQFNKTDNPRNTNSSQHSSRPTYPQRADITKTPEEIEMGVSNYGYNSEKLRPNSWDKSLSSLTPYAVNTPVSDPAVDPLDARTHSLTTSGKRLSSTSKYSDYSSVSDENPYAAPSEKSPQYEDLAAMQAKHLGRQQQQPAALPARNGERKKKMNILYEPAVITSNHKVVRSTSSPLGGKEPKQGYEEESTSYCHVIFTILVGIIGLIALVVVFLIVFGVISVKKCQECGSSQDTTGMQTGHQTGSGNTVSNAELLQELQYLRGNVTMLKKALDAVKQPNTSAKVTVLESEIQDQKLKVYALTNELALQQNLTKSLNATTVVLKSALKNTNFKMNLLNHTTRMQQAMLQSDIKSVRKETKRNISSIRAELHEVNNTLFTYVAETRLLEDQVQNKISKENFTKLIDDSQNVVNELVNRINITNTERKQLNESLHLVAEQLNTTLYTQLSTVQDTTAMLKQNLTEYNSLLTNLSTRAVRKALKSCKHDTYKKNKLIQQNGIQGAELKTYLFSKIPNNSAVLSSSCQGTAITMKLSTDVNGRYYCNCTGLDVGRAINNDLICQIDVWYCQV